MADHPDASQDSVEVSDQPAPAREFPRDMTGPTTYYEVWEHHGEKPVRRIALGVWERGYVDQETAEQDAAKLASDPAWLLGKTDPSFRVVAVTVTRTPVTASAS